MIILFHNYYSFYKIPLLSIRVQIRPFRIIVFFFRFLAIQPLLALNWIWTTLFSLYSIYLRIHFRSESCSILFFRFYLVSILGELFQSSKLPSLFTGRCTWRDLLKTNSIWTLKTSAVIEWSIFEAWMAFSSSPHMHKRLAFRSIYCGLLVVISQIN